MKRVLVIQVLMVIGACVGVSVAAATVLAGPAWTESKAARIVEREAKLAIPSGEQQSLEAELHRTMQVFRGLQLWALDQGDETAWWTYHEYANRFQSALQSVQDGLRIADADCTGSGRATGSARFRQFHCLATSGVLSIPSAKLDSSNGAMPSVIEGEPRELGPYLTQLRVRVTGKSSFAYQ